MRRLAGATAVACVLALAGSARASGETLTTTLLAAAFPTSAPWTETYSGTFTATGEINDSGTVNAQAIFGAAPLPSRSAFQSTQALSGSLGTLTLRWTQLGKDFGDFTNVPSRAHARWWVRRARTRGCVARANRVARPTSCVTPATLVDILTL